MIALFNDIRSLTWGNAATHYYLLTQRTINIQSNVLAQAAEKAGLRIYDGHLDKEEIAEICTKLQAFANNLRKLGY